jgi:hypothetical protein
VGSWTKLIVCILVIIVASFLTYAGKIPGEAGVGLITAVLGYVFGNSHAVFEQRNRETPGAVMQGTGGVMKVGGTNGG